MRVLFLLLSVFLISFARPAPTKPIHLISLPKSGTHMVFKLLDHMYALNYTPARSMLAKKSLALQHTYQYLANLYLFTPAGVYQHRQRYLYSHFKDFPCTLQIDQEKKLCQHIVLVRDPRDACVSLLHHLHMLYRSWLGESDLINFLSLSEEAQLNYVICSQQPYFFLPHNSLAQVAATMDHPDICLIRFENLVGAQGGGDDLKQRREIERIARACRRSVSDKQITELQETLFGSYTNTSCTFRKGQIGSWKRVFNEKQKALFKERYGDLLIKMGYEQDHTW